MVLWYYYMEGKDPVICAYPSLQVWAEDITFHLHCMQAYLFFAETHSYSNKLPLFAFYLYFFFFSFFTASSCLDVDNAWPTAWWKIHVTNCITRDVIIKTFIYCVFAESVFGVPWFTCLLASFCNLFYLGKSILVLYCECGLLQKWINRIVVFLVFFHLCFWNFLSAVVTSCFIYECGCAWLPSLLHLRIASWYKYHFH